MRKLLIISGVPIDDITMPEALDRIEEFILQSHATGKSYQIVTVNADFVIKAHADPELRRILQEADMSTADGMPLVWGARLLGVPLTGRVTGADLTPALAERAAQKGYSIYFLGAAPGVAARAAQVLQQRYPGLKVAGIASPPVKTLFESDQDLLQTITTAHPDILLVAFGNPKQEKWINMYAPRLSIPIMIGVGGTLDFIAGVTRRAPEWMQRAGLEWLFRFIQEPRRLWKRYIVDLTGFFVFFFRQWWAMRRMPDASPLLPASDAIMVDHTAILQVEGRLDRSNTAEFNQKAQQALALTPRIVIDLSKAVFLDSSAIGTLVNLAKQARDAGGDVTLASAPPQITKVLSLLRLDRFFEIHTDVHAAQQALQTRPATPVTDTLSVQGWTVVRMPHRLDANTSPQMLQLCMQDLGTNPHMVLDFADTSFLSSAGLAAMLQLNREAQKKGGEVRIAGCNGDVLRTIQLTRIDKTLSIFASAKQASV
jgi:N-acetylglucosaminyldiphosphoundecaprenol N-acetyl-beta-D-mannosaminyltransferase